MADSDFISINKKVKSFSSAPKLAPYDMVILDISDEVYISSPYATVDETLWQNRSNGQHTFVYNSDNEAWMYNGGTEVSTADLASLYGIEVIYFSDSSFTDAAKTGDTISVRKFTKESDDETAEPEITVTYEMTRSGSVLRTDCPLVYPDQRQSVADNLLKEMYGYEYQPFKADGAIINPAAELGDGVKAYGKYSGLYQQTITFSRLMSSNISAPSTEESESEFPYESEQERTYKRKLATVSATLTIQADKIAAEVAQRISDVNSINSLIEQTASEINASVTAVQDNVDDLYTDVLDDTNENSLKSQMTSQFQIHADQIAAKVSKEGGGTGSRSFGWVLTDTDWTLNSGSTPIFVADGSGIYVKGNGEFTGKIVAEEGTIGGFTIDDYAIYNRISVLGDTTQSYGVYIGTDGIQLGRNFTVSNYGSVTARDLEVLGGSIAIGGTSGNPAFEVSSYGNVTITNGSINIGNGNFVVDSSGNLTAKNGTFEGTVYAGNIQQKNANDTMSASYLTPSSLNANNIITPSTFNGDSLITAGSIGRGINGESTGALSASSLAALNYGDISHDAFEKNTAVSFMNAGTGAFSSLGANNCGVSNLSVDSTSSGSFNYRNVTYSATNIAWIGGASGGLVYGYPNVIQFTIDGTTYSVPNVSNVNVSVSGNHSGNVLMANYS